MRKIIIAGSAFFYKEAIEIKNELENKDYCVDEIKHFIELGYIEIYK